MPEELTHATFAGLVGQTFQAGPEGTKPLPLELIAAKLLPVQPGWAGRPPFSLVFRGPREPWLPQRIYAVWHEALQNAVLFLVPIGTDRDGMLYQAIFN